MLLVVDELQDQGVYDIYQNESITVKTQLQLSLFNFMILKK